MTRSTWLPRAVLTTLLLPCWPLLLTAQVPGGFPDRTDDSARNRRWAQERFATANAGERQVVQARFNTVEQGIEVSMRQFLTGRRGIEIFSIWTQLILEYEQLLQEPKVPLAALMRHWLQMLRSEEMAEAQFEAGMLVSSDLAQARYQRLEVQLPLARALAPGAPLPPANGQLAPASDYFLPDQYWARRRFKESSNDQSRILLGMIKTAREHFRGKWQKYLAGQRDATFASVQNAYGMLLRAEKAIQPGNDATRTFLEGQLLVLHMTYLTAVAQHAGGQIDNPTLQEALYQKLEAVEALLPNQGPRPAFRPRLFQIELEGRGRSGGGSEDTRWVLQETVATNLTRGQAFREQKLLVAQEGFRAAKEKAFRGFGDESLRIWDVRRLESSLLLQNEKGIPQRVALQVYRHAHEMEEEFEERYKQGRLDDFWLVLARCGTLNAAIRYLQTTNPEAKTKP